MSDFFEVDFLPVGDKKSGDAIAIRYQVNGETKVHIVDAGYKEVGADVLSHIEKYFEDPNVIDHVVVTHPDGDHARGVISVIESGKVSNLWMLRPWLYAEELLPRFAKFTNADNLAKRLKEVFPNIDLVEQAAQEYGVPIHEPFQGATIGAFTVLAPRKDRWFDLIVEDEKTPEPSADAAASLEALIKTEVNLIKSKWGEESFSSNETSPRNEMSVVQFASICDRSIVLTGDAGRSALQEAADYAPIAGLDLPGVHRFQVPHHGSRRNLSTELLDEWLGERLQDQPESWKGTAIISAGKDDKDHPRKAVLRALHHRAWRPIETKGQSITSYMNAPKRDGWSPVQPVPYPDDQEE